MSSSKMHSERKSRGESLFRDLPLSAQGAAVAHVTASLARGLVRVAGETLTVLAPRRGLALVAVLGAGAIIACAGVAGSLYWQFGNASVTGQAKTPVAVTIPQGTGAAGVAQALEKAGIAVPATLTEVAMRLTGVASSIQAGRYAIAPGSTLEQILLKLSRGDVITSSLRVSDGATIWQLRQAVDGAQYLRHDTRDIDEAALLKRLGASQASAEGLFAPETYNFKSDVSDMSVYRPAYQRQMELLERFWKERDPELTLKTPYELLILASLIEKETGVATDRRLVSSVFHNRLRVKMPLQTDPTIIYAIGPAFDGKIRKSDLTRPGPYNTYLNQGLPPTPICMPASESIRAAAHPEKSQFLYFVARGDGTSQFSRTLAEHNRAVNVYIRGKK